MCSNHSIGRVFVSDPSLYNKKDIEGLMIVGGHLVPLSGRKEKESLFKKYEFAEPPPPIFHYPTIAKKQRTSKAQLVDTDRQTCWTVHFGRNQKTAICQFCGRTELTKTAVANWHAGHLIPRTVCTDPTSYLYLAPICSSCNSSMGTQNAFEYLLQNFRIDALKRLCSNIYDAWLGSPGTDAATYDGLLWKFVRQMYGSHIKGGISAENEAVIYKALAIHQMVLVGNEISDMMHAVQEKSRLVEQLVKHANRPAKRNKH
jgi:hypothetical protein